MRRTLGGSLQDVVYSETVTLVLTRSGTALAWIAHSLSSGNGRSVDQTEVEGQGKVDDYRGQSLTSRERELRPRSHSRRCSSGGTERRLTTLSPEGMVPAAENQFRETSDASQRPGKVSLILVRPRASHCSPVRV